MILLCAIIDHKFIANVSEMILYDNYWMERFVTYKYEGNWWTGIKSHGFGAHGVTMFIVYHLKFFIKICMVVVGQETSEKCIQNMFNWAS